jgi:hypothetical protein
LSASEIVFAAGAAAVGVAAGSLAIFFYTRNVSDRKASVQPASLSDTAITNEGKEASEQSDKGDSLSSSQFSMTDQPRSIPKNELEKSKRELRTLLVEKELVSAALTRLYEAEASKEITRSEREILGAKYVAELKSLDDRIIKMDAFIQIGDLETLRNQLLQLVEQKIESIDRRIESTRKLAEPLVSEMIGNQQSTPPAIIQHSSVDETQRGTPIPDISDMLQNEKPEPRIDPIAEQPKTAATVITVKENAKISSVPTVTERRRPADKVEELQKEILEALDRLERLDVDSA